MAKSAVVTIRLDPRTDQALKALARQTRRSKSFLAAEAVAGYVESEAAFIAAVNEGLEAEKRGELVSHEEVVRAVRRRTKVRR